MNANPLDTQYDLFASYEAHVAAREQARGDRPAPH